MRRVVGHDVKLRRLGTIYRNEGRSCRVNRVSIANNEIVATIRRLNHVAVVVGRHVDLFGRLVEHIGPVCQGWLDETGNA